MEKLKEVWDGLVAKFGKDWAIAAVVIAVLFFIEPGLAIVAGVLFGLYKTGKLTKIIDKIKAKFASKE